MRGKRLSLEIGTVFGRLTVTGPANDVDKRGTWFKCLCECGNETVVLGRYLLSGNTKSCGCGRINNKFIDITGERFGMLTAIAPTGSTKSNGKRWTLHCDCGNEVERTLSSLKESRKRRIVPAPMSCGCMRRLGSNESARRCYLSSYKAGAERRGHDWELSEALAYALFESDCFYCGASHYLHTFRHNGAGSYQCNGIDRIDNTKGYTLANVVPCCTICNKAKGTLTNDEWYEWLKRITNHFPKLPSNNLTDSQPPEWFIEMCDSQPEEKNR